MNTVQTQKRPTPSVPAQTVHNLWKSDPQVWQIIEAGITFPDSDTRAAIQPKTAPALQNKVSCHTYNTIVIIGRSFSSSDAQPLHSESRSDVAPLNTTPMSTLEAYPIPKRPSRTQTCSHGWKRSGTRGQRHAFSICPGGAAENRAALPPALSPPLRQHPHLCLNKLLMIQVQQMLQLMHKMILVRIQHPV